VGVGEGEVLRAVVAAIGGVDNGKWLGGHWGLFWWWWFVYYGWFWLEMLWAGLKAGSGAEDGQCRLLCQRLKSRDMS
jgi:hypothetical protein